MEIRKLSSEDWQILKRLLIDSSRDCPEAFAEAPSLESEGLDKHYQDYAKKWTRYPEVFFYLIDDDGEPCGMLLGSIGTIGRLWVCRNLRKKDWGRKLVTEYYLPWLRDHRGVWVSVNVNEEMPAVKFYESLGFKRTGEEFPVVRGEKTINFIQMELTIT